MAQPPIIEIAQGFKSSKQFTIKDQTGAVVTSYTLLNALGCRIWKGQDQASLLNLTPEWITPASGTVLLDFTAADSGSLDVGTYSIQVWVVDDGGEPVNFFDGGLSVTPSAGTAAELTADISYYDLTLYVAQIRTLQDSLVDLTDFLNERHEAQQWFRDRVTDRYRPQIGRSRRYMNAAGTGPGNILTYAPGPLGVWDPPSLDDLLGYFAAGGLVVAESIRQCQAHYTASVIYLGQPGRDNVYQQAGQSHRALAMSQFDGCVIELDTSVTPSDPPTPIIRIDRDVTWLT